MLLTGALQPATWAQQSPPQADALAALDTLRAIGELLRVELSVDQSVVPPQLHPGRGAVGRLGREDGPIVGLVGELHPTVAASFDFERPVAVLELDAGALLDQAPGRPQYQPFGAFPPITQDLAGVVDDAIPAARVLSAARGGGGKTLTDVSVFDVFSGSQLGEGKRSLALRLTFRASDRTLTEEEASAARGKILKTLEREVGAVPRG